MIGLLGGISPFSTARYYQDIVAASHARSGSSPEIAIVSLDFDYFTELENASDPQPCANYLLEGLRRLAGAGATTAAIAANSAHAHLTRLERETPLPLTSIIDPVLNHVQRAGFSRLLLLGIQATVNAAFYQRRLARAGVEVLAPDSIHQEWIDNLVFSELGRGTLRPSAVPALRRIVDRYPVEAVILGCTELPLLVGGSDLGLPAVDTVALHVEAILDAARPPSPPRSPVQ